ncbi:MAG: hypothetical protein M3161_07265, partial [Actinomycetota bacterium]|nr:hypothetical protein [Actinomycetota bacterium]
LLKGGRMDGTGNVIAVYVAYSAVAIGTTAFLARTLFRNGGIFLRDVFGDRGAIADAVNRLLVVGFYMFNLGYAFYSLRASRGLDAFDATQFFINRVGTLLLVLAVMHLFNVFVFWRIRIHREQRELPPPIAPQIITSPPPAEA